MAHQVQQQQRLLLPRFSNCITNDNNHNNNNATTQVDNCNYFNLHRGNKSLIATLFLITMTAATICQSEAALRRHTALTSTSAAALLALRTTAAYTLSAPGGALAALGVGDASQSQEQQQQMRQLQQQQRTLFAMLSKNSLSASAPAPAVATTTRATGSAHFLAAAAAGADDNEPAAASSLETTGFVADDGQQYEKAEKVLAAAAAAASNVANTNANHNANNCPKECKCLNDFFDCSKQHLDRVPELANYVQVMDLAGNKLNDTTVLQIRNLPELNKLSLKRNQLETVPRFQGLNGLRQLNLANNRIQRISSESLAALPKLKSLDLSRNYLHAVESNYFPAANRLTHLMLNYNEISHVDENAFEQLPELLDLELNNNRLLTLPTSVFKLLSKLKKLSLNNNHLEITWSTFKGLHALQKLSLKSNNIRALQDGVFHVMRAIETIELDHNSITSLGRQGLFNLTKLRHLSLSNNSISRIDLDTWEFTQSLIALDLSHNNISEFKPQHLDCLQQLRHLNLAHNEIQYLVDSTFDCVKNLEELNLRRNKLAWIIEDQGATPPFRALRKLKKLDLYGNNLKQISSKSLSGLNSLETLNLNDNALATIQGGAFEHMGQLQRFKFKSLNFICDCELLWFQRWLQNFHNAQSAQNRAQLQNNAVCGYPEHLLDRELLGLAPSELVCADSPKPSITQEPSNQLTVKGANITMECIANSPAAASLAAADELKIKWRHDNQNVKERSRIGGTGGTHSSTETQIHHDQRTNQTTIFGYLRLQNVSYESAGKYQCVVSNAFGTTYSQKFKISIGIHPTFLQIPSNLTIDSGDTARLVCSASGDPMPEIALQKFGATDFPAATERRLQVIREENAFVITNAKPIDTGIYTCTAESAAGEIKINASLIVNDKPQPAIPHMRKEIVLGDSSVLECLSDLAAELYKPHREWYKDNKPFHISSLSPSERYYFTAEKELLIIVHTQSLDAGNYRCEIMDNSKTYTVQTDLIVVKEDFSQNVVFMGVILVTAACVLVGSLIVWSILYYQKRKLHSSAAMSNGGAGAGGSARVATTSHSVLSGSRGSALDQTQLTTLNRTYLQKQQQRPQSLADLDRNLNGSSAAAAAAEQRNCLIISSTPNYQQLLQRAGGGGSGAVRLEEEGLTLEYLRQDSLHDHDHNQDQLSSKDSGTGSDAAVKRSLEDFTIALLPRGTVTDISTPNKVMTTYGGHAPLTHADNYTDDDDDDVIQNASGQANEDDLEIVTTPTMGVSEYDVELCELPTESARFLQNNNKTGSSTAKMHYFDGGGRGSVDRPQASGVGSCNTTNLSTNFKANASTVQTVDI